jgi:DNA polymerase-3 subunit epsilon
MDLKKKYWFVAIIIFFLIVALIGSVLFYFWHHLSPEAQSGIKTSFEEHFDIIFLGSLFTVIFFLLIHNEIFHNYIIPLYRLNEEATLITMANPGHRIDITGSREILNISKRINEAAAIIQDLSQRLESTSDILHSDHTQERQMLAAVVAGFPQGLIVCNSQGDILLYNTRAQELITPCEHQDEYSSLSCCFLGLGRPLETIIPDHIIEQAQKELTRQTENKTRTTGYTFFIPELNEKFLKANMVAIRDHRGEMSGFFLIISEISLKGTQNDTTALHPEPAGINELKKNWPCAPIMINDLLNSLAVQTRPLPTITMAYHTAPLIISGEISSLHKAFHCLLSAFFQRAGLQHVDCTLSTTGSNIIVLFSLPNNTITKEQWLSWQEIPIFHPKESYPIRFKDILELHKAQTHMHKPKDCESGVHLEIVFQEYKDTQGSYVTGTSFPGTELPGHVFECGLLSHPCPKSKLNSLSLDTLAYTVIDLETTGLNPDKGDEIISISAVRILQNRILHEEIFQHLVNPRRTIPEQSIEIHGIEPELLEVQPGIEDVLPLFHRFTQHTVLVAHCAFFDLGFLKKKETKAGIHFDNLVLDTYCLSHLVHPHQQDHRLEAIAKRLDVPLLSRHTSFGDALTTAEIFLKLIPLLKQQGINTPEQACLASQKQFLLKNPFSKPSKQKDL